MSTTTRPRPYLSKDHLRDVITSEAGRIAVSPQEADRIVFDIASANHLPANLPTSDYNGSSVLDIGRGVQIRATGSVHLQADGSWKVTDRLHASQYPTGRELTSLQNARACELIGELIGAWAATHAGDIAQADDVDRNNGARTLEEQIAKHEAALEVLRGQLEACEQGEPFTQYPDLPTDR
jgi:hypothetical protein